MAGETITSTYTSGVVLTGADTNPVVFAPSATIVSTGSTALGANVAYNWSIQNAGLIQVASGTTGAAGIALGTASVTNLSTGRILGYTSGVLVSGTGTVVNQGTIGAAQSSGSGYAYTTIGKTATVLSAGVILGSGAITNMAGGLISGGLGGAGIDGAGSVTNAGTIAGSQFGVMLAAGGSVSNAATGTISGHYAVYSAGTAPLTLFNQGQVNAAGGNAVEMDSGGYVSNATGATISAGNVGIGAYAGNASTIINAGVVVGTTAEAVLMFGSGAVSNLTGGTLAGGNIAVALLAGGSLTNAAGGTLSGGNHGIYTRGGVAATLQNAGLVSGTTFAGVFLHGAGSLTNAAGGTIQGARYGIYASPTYTATVFNAGAITGTTVDGVLLNGAGSVTNAAGGTIAGASYAVSLHGSAASTLVNAGLLNGTAIAAALLSDGGLLSNASTGTLVGGFAGFAGLGTLATTVVNAGRIAGTNFGVDIYSANGVVTNSGSISSTVQTNGAGVDLKAGGSVTNASGGRISGEWIGVQIGAVTASLGGTLVNAGSIYGGGGAATIGAAVWIHGPAYISNAAGGTISGGPFGIVAYYATTLINSGSIGGSSFAFDPVNAGFQQRVVVNPGASFSGVVSGGNTIGSSVVSTLELASGAGAGTLSGIGTQFIEFAQVTIDSGARWTLTGANTILSGAALTDSGTLTNTGSLGGGVMLDGGVVVNALGATITGDTAAVYGPSGASAGTVLNAGVLVGGTNPTRSAGVVLFSGGYVSNAASGSLSAGGVGIYIHGAGSVANAGQITGTGTKASGVELYGSGWVSNVTGGTIAGTQHGVELDQSGTVINQGLITASDTTAVGIYMRAGGTVSNTGTVQGGQLGVLFGTSSATAGTLTNAGAITGSGGAVQFAAGFANRLIVDPGATFSGQVDGGNSIGGSVASTLELASGASTGRIGGIGSTITNFARIAVDSGATWVLTGGNSLAAGVTLTNSGTVFANGVLTDRGRIDSTGGTVIVGSTAGTNGTLTVGAGGTLAIGQAGTNPALFIGNAGASGTLAASTGTVLVTGSGAALNAYGPVLVAKGTGASGLLEFAQGATGQVASSLETIQAAIGIGLNGAGTLVVTDPGSVLTANGQVVVGRAGTGSLLVENQGTLVLADDGSGNPALLHIGSGNSTNVAQTGGSGSGTVIGGGVINGGSTTSTIQIGGNGDTGTLTVNGGTVFAGTVKLGNTTTIAGTAYTGSGTLLVGTGGVVEALGTTGASVVVGQNTGSSGTIAVNGGTLVSGNQIIVGNQSLATGVLSINAAGRVTVESAGLVAGQASGGTGTILVTNGTLADTGFFAIGGSGTGQMTISAGGAVLSSQLAGPAADIGVQAGAHGTVVVTGTGALWQVDGQFVVGDIGRGSLDISSSALVNAGTNVIDIGNQNGGSGAVSVESGGTLAGGTLNIGNPGSGTASGLLSIGSGGTVAVSSAIIGSGGTIALSGGLLDPPVGINLNAGGAITGFGTIDGSLVGAGSVVASGGLLDITGPVNGTGGLSIAAGATLELDGTVGASETVYFTPTTGTIAGGILQIGTFGFFGTVDAFLQGDSLVLAGITDVSQVTLQSPTVMDVKQVAGPDILVNLDSAYNYTGATFNFFVSGNNTFITDNVTPCYLAGTLIRTDRGEVAVEQLAIGDRVMTLDGTAKPIRWIGRRAYSSAFAAGNRDVIPILIRQGALGDGIPVRDLYVSPLHAMYVGNVLVPAEHLVNGVSVVRRPDIDPIRYFHIELERHDVIFADGAPAETFVDCDSRGMFHNAAEFAALYPDADPARWTFCAPRIETGPALDRIRRAIDARAGIGAAAAGDLRGNLDGLDGTTITGWAFDPAHPGSAVTLEVLDGDGLIARVTANRFRPDLETAGIGDGRFGFELRLSRPLSPRTRHEIRVRRAGDGKDLPGSPLILDPGDRRTLVREVRQAVTVATEAAQAPETLDALRETFESGIDLIRRLRAASRPADSGDDRLLRWAQGPRQQPKRVLIVGERLPRRDGGPHAAVLFSHIAALRGLGWAIEFVASGELARGDDAVAVLKAWDVTCHRAPAVASVEEVLRRRRAAFDLVYLAGLPNTRAYAALARLWQPRARLVCGLAVQDRTDAGPLRLVDATLVPSAADAASLALRAPGAPVHVVPWAPCPEDGSIRGSRRHGIGFIGRPNDPGYADAVSWLTGAIMPAVWQRDPRMSCLVAGFGRSVDGRIRYLASAEEVLAHVCLTVAPIRSGTGPTTLVLDSFAAGVPGVMTPAAAAGLALDDVLRTAVAEDVGAMADLICDLYFQPALHRRHAEAGLALVRRQYSPDAVAAAMAAAVGSATAPAMPRKGTAVARAG